MRMGHLPVGMRMGHLPVGMRMGHLPVGMRMGHLPMGMGQPPIEMGHPMGMTLVNGNGMPITPLMGMGIEFPCRGIPIS